MFYTGDAYEVHKREAFAAGADMYVAKPDIEGLIEGVSKRWRNEKLRRQLELFHHSAPQMHRPQPRPAEH